MYANTRVEPEDSDPEVVGGVKTYRFSGSFGGSAIYPDADFENVEVTVTPGEGSAGDTVTVRIPRREHPRPLFRHRRRRGTGSITEAYPLRVFYSVGLKDSVDLANPDAALESYVAAHNDGAGSAYFYSNAFSGTGASALRSPRPASSRPKATSSTTSAQRRFTRLAARTAQPLRVPSTPAARTTIRRPRGRCPTALPRRLRSGLP